MDWPSTMSRRSVLWAGGVVAASTAAGCSLIRPPGSTGLVLHNALTADARVMVTLTNPDREKAILRSKIVTVPPGDRLTVSDDIPRQSGHLVTIDIDDSRPSEKFRWDQVEEPLHVILHREEIVFTIEPPE